ncbi:5-dehydro-2-deoxygluconokinase [Aquicella siphonis]|uniref:5-dehydro-2-deoxygluconokinase n=1 Tax=Aquicella siphonis TaxID=254247 RepID=A0A5E4PFS5_9COXI|nr:5-dehydro-2-deoxygluconokinase [Aquicella siphonis]
MKPAWQVDSSREFDVICMGRVAVDLYAEQIGSPLEDAQTFRKYLGGCAGNIAVGSARAGLRTAMFSCVGTDAMGQFLKQELQREGVDITLLTETHEHLTGLVLLGVSPPDRFPLIFYRENCADMQLKKNDVKNAFIAQARALLITGTGLSTDSMRATTHHAVDTARSVQTRVILDLDYRPVLWGLTPQGDGETRYKISQSVSREYQALLPKCDLIVGTEEEIFIAGGVTSLIPALRAVRSLSDAPIVLKQGAQGCSVYLDNLDHPVRARAFPVSILNVLGAGDGFISGFMRGLLRGASWETCALYGNACGAIVVTRHGCAPAMPAFREMQSFIHDHTEQEAG